MLRMQSNLLAPKKGEQCHGETALPFRRRHELGADARERSGLPGYRLALGLASHTLALDPEHRRSVSSASRARLIVGQDCNPGWFPRG
jgi:hypothetical protein